MLRPRFHTRQALGGAQLTLEKDPSRHIARTLRMRAGDRLCLFDGSGHEAAATIAEIGRDAVTVLLESPVPIDRESPLAVTLAIGVSRGDSMDTVVQKATELGVQRIRPLLSERTGVRLDARRWAKKVEHWRRVAISACEQCGRNVMPTVDGPLPLDAFLAAGNGDIDQLRLLLHPGENTSTLPDQCSAVALLVGPEGGFSDAEVAAAMDAGFVGMQLGPRILRTETAPLAALSLLQARWGDLSL